MNFGINKPYQNTRKDDQMTIFKEEEKGAKWCVGSVHGKGKLWVTPTALIGNPFQFNVLFLFPLKPLENQSFLKFKAGIKSFYYPEMS